MSAPPQPWPNRGNETQRIAAAEGMAFARQWKARGGAEARWREYVADHARRLEGAEA